MEKTNDELFQELIDLYNAKDTVKAAGVAEELTGRGHVKAMGILGSLYLLGRGVPQNKEKGLELLLKAAEQDYTFAQCTLADFYVGYGFDGAFTMEEAQANTDYAQQVVWLTRAARLGDSYAQRIIRIDCYGEKE